MTNDDLEKVYEDTKLQIFATLKSIFNNINTEQSFSKEIRNKMLSGTIDGILTSFISEASSEIIENHANLENCYHRAEGLIDNLSFALKSAIKIKLEKKFFDSCNEKATRH